MRNHEFENTSLNDSFGLNEVIKSIGAVTDYSVKEKKESIFFDELSTSHVDLNDETSSRFKPSYFKNPVYKNNQHQYLMAADKTDLKQKWEGYVLSIDEEKEQFTAVISDKSNKDFPDEEVVLSIEELSTSDLIFLKSGAVFYWSIGYAYKGASKIKFSAIRFSRLKGYSKESLKVARSKAEEMMELLRGC
jgi:hypothetical protein